MASKKQKVKAAKAREQQRLYFKDHPDENTNMTGVSTNVDEDRSSAPRRKDTRGKKIPTEAERKRRSENRGDKGEASDPIRAGKRDSASYRTFGTSRTASSRSTRGEERGLFSTLVIYAKQHIFATAVVLVVLVAMIVAAYAASSALSQNSGGAVQGNEKAKSMIGQTMPAREIIEDIGKFDGFFVEPDSGIPYAKMFDDVVTAEEAAALTTRGQMTVGDGTFEYNKDISSAARSETGASSADDASHKTEISSE